MTHKGIFHSGISARAFDCGLVLQNDVLHVYVEDGNNTLLIWNLTSFQSCQYSGDILLITYGNYPHQTLECAGEMARMIYDRWSDNKPIQKAEGFVFKGRGTTVFVLIAAFILIGLLAYFYILPWAGEKAASLIPKSAEIELGNSLADLYKQNNLNDSATHYINRFASNINFDSDYDLNIHVLNSEEINAFALPGGKIFVYSGIINKMHSYEELAALLGHEATHVIKQHSLKSICRSAAGSLFVAALFGDVTGISSGIISQADEFKQLGYSRELETEADNNGYQIMLNNRINPEGMLDLLELLKKEGAEMSGLMKYLSTHPDTEARIENISSQLTKNNKASNQEELETCFRKIQEFCED